MHTVIIDHPSSYSLPQQREIESAIMQRIPFTKVEFVAGDDWDLMEFRPDPALVLRNEDGGFPIEPPQFSGECDTIKAILAPFKGKL